MIDPFEDNVSEVRFRRQRVEMERRVSSSVSDSPLDCVGCSDSFFVVTADHFTILKSNRLKCLNDTHVSK